MIYRIKLSRVGILPQQGSVHAVVGLAQLLDPRFFLVVIGGLLSVLQDSQGCRQLFVGVEDVRQEALLPSLQERRPRRRPVMAIPLEGSAGPLLEAPPRVFSLSRDPFDLTREDLLALVDPQGELGHLYRPRVLVGGGIDQQAGVRPGYITLSYHVLEVVFCDHALGEIPILSRKAGIWIFLLLLQLLEETLDRGALGTFGIVQKERGIDLEDRSGLRQPLSGCRVHDRRQHKDTVVGIESVAIDSSVSWSDLVVALCDVIEVAIVLCMVSQHGPSVQQHLLDR